MTARCGSNDKEHRADGCAGCNRIYHRRSASGAPPFSQRVRADPAVCIMCNIVAGNGADIAVYRYPLKRTLRGGSTVWIGSIGMCDECLHVSATLKPGVLLPRPRRECHEGLRSSDASMPASLGS